MERCGREMYAHIKENKPLKREKRRKKDANKALSAKGMRKI